MPALKILTYISIILVVIASSFFAGAYLSRLLSNSLFSEWFFFSNEHHLHLRIFYSSIFAYGIMAFFYLLGDTYDVTNHEKTRDSATLSRQLATLESIGTKLESIDTRLKNIERIFTHLKNVDL